MQTRTIVVYWTKRSLPRWCVCATPITFGAKPVQLGSLCVLKLHGLCAKGGTVK